MPVEVVDDFGLIGSGIEDEASWPVRIWANSDVTSRAFSGVITSMTAAALAAFMRSSSGSRTGIGNSFMIAAASLAPPP